MLLDQIITGLAAGCIYALVALGYSLIYSSVSLLHFAQGSLLMLGGVFGFTLISRLKFSLFLAMPAVVLLLVCVGIFLERGIYRHVTKASPTIRIICTLGVNIMIPNLVIVLWGSEPSPLPSHVLGGAPFTLLGFPVQPVYYWIFIIVTIVVMILTLFLKRTNAGLTIRATALDPKVASLMGINTSITCFMSFAIGSALAGIAGILAGKILFISYDMGSMIGIKGFVAAVIGGFGNLPGALVGGLILGVLENIGGGFISTAYKDSIAFFLMIVILVLLPSGLLGKKRLEKV